MPMSRGVKLNITIFLSVNALLLVLWAALTIAGVRLHSHLWPWPVVMALWAGRIALGVRARRQKTYPEEKIRREMKRIA